MSAPSAVIFPVKDLDAAKATFTTLIGQPPTTDSPYYVGWTVGGIEVGLNPHGHAEGLSAPVPYFMTDDIEGSVAALTGSGAEVRKPAAAVGGGRTVALLADADGNVLGLMQDA